ncbi:hypothetical protein F7725_027025 [Dissostichus mawsoni]|uniref:RWD domain-containing protein 3 n=1 Tax=Dissostichus mawsoni TaxID=36200 RepID=A0A7J5X8N9_DISMA|nr:hypothetical protein F7725_027025 [Dissostichus mawsoni]
MSEAALEEVSVLSSIYCGEGELTVRQQDGWAHGADQQQRWRRKEAGRESVVPPAPPYPLCPPAISVSSSSLSRTQCQDIRQKLLGQAAALPPEPMVHRLRWSLQLQLTGRLLLGRCILVILLGARPSIKEFCRLLKTVKVDLDSSGRKCKERMMKGFVVKSYESLPELSAAFQELNMTEIYQQILPSLSG